MDAAPGDLHGCALVARGRRRAPAIVHLCRCSTFLKLFVADQDAVHLEKALVSQKALWKYYGILSTVVTALMLLVLPMLIGLAGPWA